MLKPKFKKGAIAPVERVPKTVYMATYLHDVHDLSKNKEVKPPLFGGLYTRIKMLSITGRNK